MTPEAQQIAILNSLGWNPTGAHWGNGVPTFWKHKEDTRMLTQFPDYLNDRNALFDALSHHGIANPENLEIRVKYANHLRDIVGRRMPKNKSGSPLTSDVDLLMAENSEIAEALLRAIKKWKSDR